MNLSIVAAMITVAGNDPLKAVILTINDVPGGMSPEELHKHFQNHTELAEKIGDESTVVLCRLPEDLEDEACERICTGIYQGSQNVEDVAYYVPDAKGYRVVNGQNFSQDDIINEDDVTQNVALSFDLSLATISVPAHTAILNLQIPEGLTGEELDSRLGELEGLDGIDTSVALCRLPDHLNDEDKERVCQAIYNHTGAVLIGYFVAGQDERPDGYMITHSDGESMRVGELVAAEQFEPYEPRTTTVVVKGEAQIALPEGIEGERVTAQVVTIDVDRRHLLATLQAELGSSEVLRNLRSQTAVLLEMPPETDDNHFDMVAALLTDPVEGHDESEVKLLAARVLPQGEEADDYSIAKADDGFDHWHGSIPAASVTMVDATAAPAPEVPAPQADEREPASV